MSVKCAQENIKTLPSRTAQPPEATKRNGDDSIDNKQPAHSSTRPCSNARLCRWPESAPGETSNVRELLVHLVCPTVNGIDLKSSFSESVTNINYVGFGVQNAETLFTEPAITR